MHSGQHSRLSDVAEELRIFRSFISVDDCDAKTARLSLAMQILHTDDLSVEDVEFSLSGHPFTIVPQLFFLLRCGASAYATAELGLQSIADWRMMICRYACAIRWAKSGMYIAATRPTWTSYLGPRWLAVKLNMMNNS